MFMILVGGFSPLTASHVCSSNPEDVVNGEEIRNLRKRKNLTQEQLASILRVGVASVRRWEADSVKPTENNLALLKQLMVTPDATSLSHSEKGFQGSLEDLHKKLLADAGVKRTLASRMVEVDFSGVHAMATLVPQPFGILEAGNSSGQIEPGLPFPRTPTEKANARQGELTGEVDAALIELFEQEREARGLTTSKMLETILWKYFGYPAMSFQLREEDGALENSTNVIEDREDRQVPQSPEG